MLTTEENGETNAENEQQLMNQEDNTEFDQEDSEVADTIRNGLTEQYENMKNKMMQQERDNVSCNYNSTAEQLWAENTWAARHIQNGVIRNITI